METETNDDIGSWRGQTEQMCAALKLVVARWRYVMAVVVVAVLLGGLLHTATKPRSASILIITYSVEARILYFNKSLRLQSKIKHHKNA